MIKPAIQGVINVLKSCLKSKSVKRVIYTSSAAAVSINNDSGTGRVMNEENWTDIEFLREKKPFNWVITFLVPQARAFSYINQLINLPLCSFLGLPNLEDVSRKDSLGIFGRE